MTKKEAYYFPHDSNSRNDEKVIKLRMSLGWEGYGIYWAIVEKLRDAKDYELSLDFNLIAFDLRTDNQKIKSIVTGFDLFSIDEKRDCFYSESLKRRMLIKEKKSVSARESANKRWGNANAMRMHSDGNAIKEKKRKEKKKKVNKDTPSLEDFKNYALEKMPEVDLEKLNLKYQSWIENDWRTGKDTEIKNWKSTLLNTLPYLKKEKSSAKKEKVTASIAFENLLKNNV